MTDQKYRVIRRLAAGGMAEVFLGESSSVQGFVKQVAIKRVLPHLAQNQKFIQMFLDEARLSARLNHANIVTVFDIGATNNTYFLVMEFVDGTNLKDLIENVRKRGSAFEPKQACYIGIEVCRGLSYAHELTDAQGAPLGIVHRDISPPNIMITNRGEIKVADFGLAKAGIQVEKTEPGVVKGKFSYLAPEIVNGEAADARSDIFSLGVVLWEMLAGRRLFLGETDYKTVKLVQRANVPRLSPLNQYVDESIEEIIFKALAKDSKDRHQTAREFGDRLAGYLADKGVKFTAFDMANLVTGLTSDQAKWQPKEDSVIDRMIQQELMKFTSIGSGGQPGVKNAAPPPRHTGAFRADGESLENPAEWFTRESEFPAPMPTSQQSPEPQVLLEPANAPSGAALEPNEPARSASPPLAAEASRAPAQADIAPHALDKSSKDGDGKKYLLLSLFAGAVIMAAMFAAAWFAKIIPH